MKKILIGIGIGMCTTILGILTFMGIIAYDNCYSRNSPSKYWYW